jgi:hypothetical protein
MRYRPWYLQQALVLACVLAVLCAEDGAPSDSSSGLAGRTAVLEGELGGELEGLPHCADQDCVVDFAFELWHGGHKVEAVTWLRYALTRFPNNTHVLGHLGLMVEETEGKAAAVEVRGPTTRAATPQH